jgi:hypothetical protein
MGCHSSKDVDLATYKKQEESIKKLIGQLEEKIKELNQPSDMTSLRTTIDMRFSKLEKTIEKIQAEVKMKMFEEGLEPDNNIINGLNMAGDINNPNERSLTSLIDREISPVDRQPVDTQWNDLLHDSMPTPIKIGTQPDELVCDETSPRNNPGKMMKKFSNNDNNILNANDINIRVGDGSNKHKDSENKFRK